MRARAALAFSLLVAGCATPGAPPKPAPYAAAPRAAELKSLPALIPGKSTKADVLGALGRTTVIDFDSGYEVWVYLMRSERKDAEPTELVILFNPSGVVARTRTRAP